MVEVKSEPATPVPCDVASDPRVKQLTPVFQRGSESPYEGAKGSPEGPESGYMGSPHSSGSPIYNNMMYTDSTDQVHTGEIYIYSVHKTIAQDDKPLYVLSYSCPNASILHLDRIDNIYYKLTILKLLSGFLITSLKRIVLVRWMLFKINNSIY